MGEPERVPGNSEPALSQDEVVRLRRLLSGKSDNQAEAPDPYRSFHEVGVELRSMNSRLDLMQSSINSRLDLMQKVFGGSALFVIACFGYLFVKTTDISVSVGKIETRLVGIDERFDAIDERFEGIDERFEGIDKRLDGVDKRLDGLDKRLDGIDKRFDGLGKRLDVITALLTPPKAPAAGPP
jgi:hypothetical protein